MRVGAVQLDNDRPVGERKRASLTECGRVGEFEKREEREREPRERKRGAVFVVVQRAKSCILIG